AGDARPLLASITDRAGVPITARGVVRLDRVGARAGPRIADTDRMALVKSLAGDRRERALTVHALIEGAEITVIADMPAAAAVGRVVLEIRVDRVAVGPMGRHGTLG